MADVPDWVESVAAEWEEEARLGATLDPKGEHIGFVFVKLLCARQLRAAAKRAR